MPHRSRYFGEFNLSKPKTDLEWTIHRGKLVPGPGSYQVRTEGPPKVSGGRFNESRGKSTIEWVEYYAKGAWSCGAGGWGDLVSA